MHLENYGATVEESDVTTYQMQDGVDYLPVGHLSDFNQPDKNSEFQAIVRRHPDHFFRSFDITKRRRFKVRHGLCCHNSLIHNFKIHSRP